MDKQGKKKGKERGKVSRTANGAAHREVNVSDGAVSALENQVRPASSHVRQHAPRGPPAALPRVLLLPSVCAPSPPSPPTREALQGVPRGVARAGPGRARVRRRILKAFDSRRGSRRRAALAREETERDGTRNAAGTGIIWGEAVFLGSWGKPNAQAAWTRLKEEIDRARREGEDEEGGG
ncbi:hypothetical protein KM043_000531 [Ampulex compressa]|nr:hypothetical protein KM043_000531 [Ampulex compressa]